MNKEAEIREMLAKNTHVKVIKGSLKSRFDPYSLSNNAKKPIVGHDRRENVGEDEKKEIVDSARAKPKNLAIINQPFRSKTERRFAERLVAAESMWYFEPITLCVSRVGDRKLTYTPDFLIVEDDRLTFIEVKGGFIRDKGVRNFDMAVQQYGHIFDFEMWQWKDNQWSCIRRSR